MKITDPVSYFTQRAQILERFAPAAAEAYLDAAEVFERWFEGQQLEPLDLATAEVESGYTRGHLRRMIAEGKLRNVGTENDPRILRGHLPRKPGYGTGVANARPQLALSRTQVARAVASGD